MPDHAPSVVVTAGTGAGKTEAFLLPMLGGLSRTPRSQGETGMRALILYPMNALVTDQVSRLYELLREQEELSLFHFTSDTPETDRQAKPNERWRPSNTYGTSTMAGTGPAISTKYGGLYLGLAAGDPSYGIDVNPISNSPNGTRVLSYSMASFCFTSSYPEVDCPIQASNNGNLTIGRAFEGQQVAQNNGLLVQNRVGIGTITPMSTLFVQGTTSYPTLNLFTLASTTGTQLFTVTPAGNVGIGTSTPTLGPLTMASGAYVTTGGVWTNASDRNLKENFATVSLADILQKIDQLPVIEWNYQNEDPSIKHVGPVAQDFYAIFQVGNSSTSISTIDPAGIALLGIQALNQKFTVLQG